MIGLQLTPLDTLFFGNGTPTSADSASQDDVGGVFPPHPPSMVGSIRAALGRNNGWQGHGSWSRDPGLTSALGDGLDLGPLAFEGPYLLRDGQPVFPAPRHLLGIVDGNGWQPRALLRPGPSIECDLDGAGARLPEPPAQSVTDQDAGDTSPLKPGAGWWLTAEGMATVLQGRPPDKNEVVAREQLWRDEHRVGLARDHDTRTAVQGMLYTARHIRLQPGVTLGVRVGGHPDGWAEGLDGHLFPLGGEARLVECDRWDGEPVPQGPLTEIVGSGRVLLVALTPLALEMPQVLGQATIGLPGGFGDVRVVSACLDRPQRIGGWDSVNRTPLPVRSLLSAGSALFCELSGDARAGETDGNAGGALKVGERTQWGFGAVALGAWPADSEGAR